MTKSYSDTMLMAYADGELTAEQRAEIETALIDDQALASRVAAFSRTRSAASEAFEPLLDTPVPDSLRNSIEEMVARSEKPAEQEPASEVPAPDNVIAFDRRRRFGGAWTDLALAASVALIVGGVAGYLVAPGGEPAASGAIVAADFDDPAIVTALQTVPSGEELGLGDDARFRAIASFRDEADDFCREFEIENADSSTVVAVACQADEAWRVQFTVVAGVADGGYAPASSLEALSAYLSSIGAGEPLSVDDEEAALGAMR